MIIKPGKFMLQQLLVLLISSFVGCAMISLYSLIELGHLWVGLATEVLILLLMTPYAVSSMRTFTMDETGCTVSILCYKKHYRWDELQLKQYVTYEGILRSASRSPCTKVAEFCSKKVNIPKKMDAHSFSCYRHPLSFIFVQFPPSKTWDKDISESTQMMNPIVYEADEELFRANMEEWGVEMTETKRGMWV